MARAAASHFLRFCFRCCSSTISHQNLPAFNRSSRYENQNKNVFFFSCSVLIRVNTHIDIVFIATSSFFFCLPAVVVVVVANLIKLRHKTKRMRAFRFSFCFVCVASAIAATASHRNHFFASQINDDQSSKQTAIDDLTIKMKTNALKRVFCIQLI